jgi:hypothetical protein
MTPTCLAVRIALLTIFPCLPFLLSAQPGLKAHALAGAPSSTTPAPAAGAGAAASPAASNYQTGHVYRLKHKKHIQYNSIITQAFYFRLADIPAGDRPGIFGRGVSAGYLTTVNLKLDRTIRQSMSAGPLAHSEYLIRPIDPVTKICVQKPKCDPDPNPDDTVLAVFVTYYDSIPRYFNKEERLRYSVNQDSALLNLQVYTIIDNDASVVAVDKAKASNPYYRYLSSKKSREQAPQQFNYQFVYAAPHRIGGPAFYEADTSDAREPQPVVGPAGQAYTAALATYKRDLFNESTSPSA